MDYTSYNDLEDLELDPKLAEYSHDPEEFEMMNTLSRHTNCAGFHYNSAENGEEAITNNKYTSHIEEFTPEESRNETNNAEIITNPDSSEQCGGNVTMKQIFEQYLLHIWEEVLLNPQYNLGEILPLDLDNTGTNIAYGQTGNLPLEGHTSK